MTYVPTESSGSFSVSGESKMLPPLLGYLRRMGWVRSDSLVVQELPVHGRRVDLVTLTRSGTLSAYELKLSGLGRALEQAAYNTHSFDRSWVVAGSTPLATNIETARRHGIGILVVEGDTTRILVRPGSQQSDRAMRERVRARLMLIRESNVR